MERSFLLIVGLLNTCSKTLLLSVITGSGTNVQDSPPESCPPLGSDFRTPFTQSIIRERLFINFGGPAQCNATVSSWHYCYYNRFTDDKCGDAVSYTTKFLVYRQTGNSTYEPVPGSAKLVTLSLRCPSDGGFQCRTVSLQQSEQFTIQKNDIVAACLMDRPIRVVGYETSGPSQNVYQYNARCTTSNPTINTQNSAFTPGLFIYKLHLYAETSIGPVTQCSGGSNPPPFTPSVISGTYLNTDNPINCTDTITSWHYCYYPSAAANSTLTYSATVGVWRMNAAMNQYELIRGSDHTLQLIQPQSTPAKVFCKTEVLQPMDYVRVLAGDIIGVNLPTINPLPLVASQANGYSLKIHNASNSSILQSVSLTNGSNMALHLYPTIEYIPLPTTEPPTTIAASTMLHSQTTEIPGTIPPTTGVTTYPTSELPLTIHLSAEVPTTVPPTAEIPTTTPSTTGVTTYPTSELPITIHPSAEVPTTVPPTAEIPTTTPSTADLSNTTSLTAAVVSTTMPPTAEQTTTSPTTVVPTTVPQTTEVPTTITLPTMEALPTTSTAQLPTIDNTNPTTEPKLLPVTTPNETDGIQIQTTIKQSSTVTDRFTLSETTGDSRAESTRDEESTTASALGSSGQRISPGDYAAIALGVLMLIVIIFIVAGVIAFKKRLCTIGPRKKASAMYTVANGTIQVNNDSLLRYMTRHRRSLHSSDVDSGITHNIPPLYEKDGIDTEAAPYEVPIVTINHGAQAVYYSTVEKGVMDYSVALEQVIEGKKLEEEEDPYHTPATKESELYAQLHEQGIKMIRDRDIEVTGVLGEGQFGQVRKGIWRNQSGFLLETAVKTLKPGATKEDKVKFLQEAAIMAQFKHPNVITLYGVVSTGGMIMIVVEVLPKGDLKRYLQSMRPDPGQLLPSFTPRNLLAFCQQIALGMQYLASKGFVHRDLAARNILLSEGGICKIADFGMSRDLAEEDYYVSHGGKVPIKWTAPEALHFRKYSTASDVWSYGCVMYEIWSLGNKPFGAMQNREVLAKVDSGYRLQPPPGCPRAIYKIMIDCWNPSTMQRPGFRNILLALLEDEEQVLNIPSRDVGSNGLAVVLGAPLDSAFNMYPELQTKYYDDITTSL